jgi:hypothetical protein
MLDFTSVTRELPNVGSTRTTNNCRNGMHQKVNTHNKDDMLRVSPMNVLAYFVVLVFIRR